MANYTSITTHHEKVQFVKDYINGSLEKFPTNKPLMLLGSGGNGKSAVVQEITANTPVNLLVLNAYEGYRFYPAATPSDQYILLLIGLGTGRDLDLADSLDAHIVRFEKDPQYSAS